MPLAWDKSLSVGVAELDAQHREIIARLKMLGEAIGSERREAAAETLRGLIACLVFHFESEERFMRQRSYPHLPAHARAHKLGLEVLERAAKVYAEGGTEGRFLELMERSARWIEVHLRSEDLRLGMFSESERHRARGITAGPKDEG